MITEALNEGQSDTQIPIELTDKKEVDLRGKVAVITGGTRGIGRSIALRLAAHGAQIAINSRESERSEADSKEVLDYIKSVQSQGIWIGGDIGEKETAQRIVEQTMAEFGRVDILVSNAGIRGDGTLLKMSEEKWDTVIRTHLRGAFLMTQAVLRPMLRQRSGSIIYISSAAANGSPGQANYAAAKAGIEGLARTTSLEYAQAGIRANCIALGLVPTELVEDLNEKQEQAILAVTPMGRKVSLLEASNAALFLASEMSSATTGQVLRVDGGMVRT